MENIYIKVQVSECLGQQRRRPTTDSISRMHAYQLYME